MIKLYGAALSPYYNKVKIALLEKGVNFEEILQRPSRDPEVLSRSPLGKIPFVDINGMPLSESTVILEWLEDAYPTASLLPPTPNGRARARQLATLIDLYLMPACTPLQMHLLFDAPLDAETKEGCRTAMQGTLAAIASLGGRGGPWLTGEDFTVADVSAAATLPGVAWLSRTVFGEDLVAAGLPGADEYLARLGARGSVARTWADRERQLQRWQASRAQS